MKQKRSVKSILLFTVFFFGLVVYVRFWLEICDGIIRLLVLMTGGVKDHLMLTASVLIIYLAGVVLLVWKTFHYGIEVIEEVF